MMDAHAKKFPVLPSEKDDSAERQSPRCNVQLSHQCPNRPPQERRDVCECKCPCCNNNIETTLCFLRMFCANFHEHAHTDFPVAQVTARLLGSEGESDTHHLTDLDKPVFERGAVDVFLLAAPFPLGEVRNLRLQHDNSGGCPSWYCRQGRKITAAALNHSCTSQ